jgi:hypothetical protein
MSKTHKKRHSHANDETTAMNASAAMASTTSSSSVASLDLLTAALGKGMPPVTPRTSSRQGRQAKLIRRAMAAPDSDAVGLGEELQPVLDELSSRAEYILSGRVKKLRGNIRAVSSEFVCATCKKLFDAPRRLACGHVACLDCVDDSCSVCRKPTHPHRPATDIQDQFAALPCSCDLALCDWTGPLANVRRVSFAFLSFSSFSPLTLCWFLHVSLSRSLATSHPIGF